MTVYNINLGIGWASSGVEYAQAYRAQLLRNIHQPAKFVFMDMILMQDRHILLFFFTGKDCFLECSFQSVLLLHRFIDQVT